MLFGRRADRFDRFTARAREVLTQAEHEAARLEHGYIGTEHLLLGILAEGEGVGARVLQGAGFTLDMARQTLDSIVPPRQQPHLGPRGLTPRGKKVVEEAVAEAKELGHSYVGTEHLLLGLARVHDGVAAGILAQNGCTLERLRERIVGLIAESGGTADPPPDAAPTRDNVLTCRVGDEELVAIDALVAAGARATRSEAAAWLIRAGIDANAALFEKVHATAREIERLRAELAKTVRKASAAEKGD